MSAIPLALKLRLFVHSGSEGKSSDTRMKRRRIESEVMPGWTTDIIEAVAQYMDNNKKGKVTEDYIEELKKILVKCSQSLPSESIGGGFGGQVFEMSNNKVYKRMDSESIFDVPNIVIEALIQARIHKYVPKATPHACVCMLDDAPVIVTERLGKSLTEVNSNLTKIQQLDLMAQLTIIYLNIISSPDILNFHHGDLIPSNIMCTKVDEPVSFDEYDYTSRTNIKWQLIDFGQSSLETRGECCLYIWQKEDTDIEELFTFFNSNFCNVFSKFILSEDNDKQKLLEVLDLIEDEIDAL